MSKLRVKFIKKGPIKYIGHLDVMRYFQKVMRRAEIDIKYSTGFSPHQIMSFSAPLGLGMESEAEYMDIEVNTYYDFNKMIQDINAVSSPGLYVKEIVLLPDNAENAMASMQAADYRVEIKKDRLFSFNLQEAIQKYNEMPSYVYEKETKKGSREINLKEFIYKLEYLSENSFYMFVCANSGDNIKPMQVLKMLYDIQGDELPNNPCDVTRIDSYTIINEKYVSLGDIR